MSRRGGDRGVTLVELLVAVTLMAIAFGAVLGGLGLAYRIQSNQKANSTIDLELRNYAERVGDLPYVACAPGVTPSYSVAAPTGLSATVGVEFFTGVYGTNGAEFAATCGTRDHGAQRLTVTLTDPRGITGTLRFGKAP